MNDDLRRLRFAAAIAGVLALCGCAALGRLDPQQALLSYLAAWLFFLGCALGSIAMLLIHALTGGRWGIALRPAWLAAMGLLPWLAVLAAPILLGARWLYPWMSPAWRHIAALRDPQFASQRWYLDYPFFLTRGVACLVLWLVLAGVVHRKLVDVADGFIPQGLAAAGLIVMLLTTSIAAVDWIMSLMPAWHSSIFGVTAMTSHLLCAMAVAVVHSSRRDTGSPVLLRDFGNLLLALLLAWSYLVFMDFLTAWIADLPADTVWYLPRSRPGWLALAAAIGMLGLALPFALLLSGRVKEHPGALRVVAMMILLAQALYCAWLVLPDLRPFSAAWHGSDALAWLGLGALCWSRMATTAARSKREVAP